MSLVSKFEEHFLTLGTDEWISEEKTQKNRRVVQLYSIRVQIHKTETRYQHPKIEETVCLGRGQDIFFNTGYIYYYFDLFISNRISW